jgi:hypothetical protein
MINPETVSEAFIKWLEDENIGTFDTDIYLNQVPLKAPDTCYWIITSGGDVIQKLRTGEKVKQYFILVNYRSPKGKLVEKNLFKLEELLNCAECITLEGFEVLEVEATQFPSDSDLDDETRRVGLLQANIKIYKKEC